MRLIDIGVNLANNQFSHDLPEVLERAHHAGVDRLILTGTSLEASHKLLELTASLDSPCQLYSTAGVHPHDAKDYQPQTTAALKSLAAEQQVVAIGETGLDFNRNYSPPEQQVKAFEAQLEIASETQLPVFLHERDAHQQQLEILKHYRDHLSDGVIHCFTGDQQSLFNYLDLDLHIGITGWICDERRGQALQQLVHNIPLNRLMLETDAPYLLPRTISPKPSSRRNEPGYLTWVLASVAAHRPEDQVAIATATTQTAELFFRLPN